MDLANAVLAALIIGLVEVAKQLGLPSRFAALLAVALGVALVAVQQYLQGKGGDVILAGIATGLAAAGLYSGAKSLSGR